MKKIIVLWCLVVCSIKIVSSYYEQCGQYQKDMKKANKENVSLVTCTGVCLSDSDSDIEACEEAVLKDIKKRKLVKIIQGDLDDLSQRHVGLKDRVTVAVNQFGKNEYKVEINYGAVWAAGEEADAFSCTRLVTSLSIVRQVVRDFVNGCGALSKYVDRLVVPSVAVSTEINQSRKRSRDTVSVSRSDSPDPRKPIVNRRNQQPFGGCGY